jgi:rhodanese-related sulfurtransferase
LFSSKDEFEMSLVELLDSRHLDTDATVILMCRSGKRSAEAANFLSQLGYRNVYTVVDGFEGDVAKIGPAKGQRVLIGWKNAGLPWTYKSTKDKYFPDYD